MQQPSTMLDHPLVSSRYFFPRREVVPNPYWVDAADGSKLRRFQGCTLVLHTRHDELVHVRHAELLYAAAPEPKALHIFDQGGHNDIFYRNRQAYMQLVETFLATLGRGR